MFLQCENACRRRGGRPLLPADERRTRRVTVSLRAEEHRLLSQRAREAGLPLSVYIREASLDAQLSLLANRAAYRELSRVGVNLNQLARWANTYRRLPELRKLHAVLDELLAVRRTL